MMRLYKWLIVLEIILKVALTNKVEIRSWNVDSKNLRVVQFFINVILHIGKQLGANILLVFENTGAMNWKWKTKSYTSKYLCFSYLNMKSEKNLSNYSKLCQYFILTFVVWKIQIKTRWSFASNDWRLSFIVDNCRKFLVSFRMGVISVQHHGRIVLGISLACIKKTFRELKVKICHNVDVHGSDGKNVASAFTRCVRSRSKSVINNWVHSVFDKWPTFMRLALSSSSFKTTTKSSLVTLPC